MASIFNAAPKISQTELKRERESLTVEERTAAEDDIHGRKRGPPETTEFVRESAEKLRCALESMKGVEKACYEEALGKGAEMTTSDEDLVLFLRSENFCPKASARRLALYWKHRIELFGPERAFKPLSCRGMLASDEDDTYALLMNSMYVLRGRDTFSRSILYLCPTKRKMDYKLKSMLRVVWCVCHDELRRDPTNSMCGNFIHLANLKKVSYDLLDRKLRVKVWDALENQLPLKLTALHMCHRPGMFQRLGLLPIVLQMFGKRLRLRLIEHPQGTNEEVLRGLQTYGISRSVIPVEMGGDAKEEGWSANRLFGDAPDDQTPKNIPASKECAPKKRKRRGSQSPRRE